ncbi:SusC/RagA family TonB-linked outer membrane protein [Chitinophaga agrisoli]|uniref:SusC/RagA family TonB-linked outer membrane protein n=1 Tax=Chitinophaga agrisoli TaxID=2607653 RepID=A0A5B2VP80_9BACT|nr:SusC/RagA family TonB-linked outer membrane protein [Chitinophaga agrisoli]KAA2239889.1 SusC/RagA family TonB-linked outer membrane protein [Chitinophaga agrisoli]
MQPTLHRRSCIFYKLLLTALVLACSPFANHLQAARQPTSQDLTVTYSGTNVPLGQVFKAIQKQTGYIAMYNVAATKIDTKEKVTVNFNSTPLGQVMDIILRGKNLEWQLDDESILIFIKKESDRPKKSPSEGDSTIVRQSLTGKVTDADGKPIIGATVVVKGTTNGATTDPEGNFSLANVKGNAALVISSIGFQTREVPVRGKTILAQLNVMINILDEQVVIPYGTTTKRLSTSNTVTIKASEIEKQPVGNPLLALQGRVPGLFITQSTGLPNSGVTVRIQGQNSITKGNDPLYVIDGVPYTSQLLPTLATNILGSSGGALLNGVNSGSGNPLSFINPADIESIDVLKDADATAIYGSRAANGAILITTKKGKSGETTVSVNMQTGWGKVTRKLDLMNTQQYLTMRREAKKNDNDPIFATDYDINGLWDTTRYTDWQKELIGGTAKYTDVQASVAGGTVNTQFLIGSGYHRETTVFPGDFADEKGSFHINIRNTSINQKFQVLFTGNYLIDNNKLMGTDYTSTALSLAPNAPNLYNQDGSINWMPNASGSSTFFNPLAQLNRKYRNRTTNLISSLTLSYQLLPDFEIRSSFNYTTLRSDEISTQTLEVSAPEIRPTAQRSASYGDGYINSWIIEPQGVYKRKIGKGQLEVLLGATFQQNSNNRQEFSAAGFNSDAVLEDIKSASNVTVAATLTSVYKYSAAFGRLTYNWKDKYLLNLTARRDGSSRFGSENQLHNFGSVGLGWVFSGERLIRDHLPFVSFGKLRGSYGTSGNDQIGDYQYLNLYRTITLGVPYQGFTGMEVTSIPNPHLQWEETKKVQFGLDLGLIGDRIMLIANYYQNRSSNQLLSYSLPAITGFGSISAINFPATVGNFGWEFSINTVNIKANNFNWSTGFNLTIPRNKLIEFPNLETSTLADVLVIGKPVSIIRAYNLSGVNPATGEYQFRNAKEEPTTYPDFSTDQTQLINVDPKYYGGIRNSLSYKGIELDVLLQFVKQTGRDYSLGLGDVPGVLNANQPVALVDRWQKPGDVAKSQRYNSNYALFLPFYYASNVSNAAYADASFIRVKNVSLSYELPYGLKKKMHLRNCRIYAQAQNLFTITKYTGLNPENGNTISLPPLRMITVGIQATL